MISYVPISAILSARRGGRTRGPEERLLDSSCRPRPVHYAHGGPPWRRSAGIRPTCASRSQKLAICDTLARGWVHCECDPRLHDFGAEEIADDKFIYACVRCRGRAAKEGRHVAWGFGGQEGLNHLDRDYESDGAPALLHRTVLVPTAYPLLRPYPQVRRRCGSKWSRRS